ncbi:MAG: hypothetical protein OZ921_03230 [Sorangiineae bacterium]|nr:hypothetical protein [Polyangiaceae bacterium]MEB2321501.1 hypothetical protein [Sorangiineae bacterium]
MVDGAASRLRRGYDRRSLVALAALVVVGGAVGYRFSDLIDVSGGFDYLLAFTWLVMTALLVWNVDARHDLTLLVVAFAGGAVIEWWGTSTQLWSYFTVERPPLWILPAWPIAALAIDRLAVGLHAAFRARGTERQYRALYWLIMPGFIAAMTRFAWPTIHMRATLVVVALMLALLVTVRDHRRDVTMFAGGSLLGFFLEYWGTSRECWTYYTREVPPLECVFAHGFAAIAFARGAALAERLVAVALAVAPRRTGIQA